MLSSVNLSCVRGERTLFTGLGLSVAPGQWLHVRGANGCGKTSLLRLLAGLSRPEAGDVLWAGEPIAQLGAAWRRVMLFLGHHAAVKDDLTARENLALAGALDDCNASDADVTTALHRFGLKGREDLPVRVMSAGQKRRVLLARLQTRKASLWILDEPFTALDTKAVEMLSDLVGEHLAAGGCAVITSHQPVPLASGKVLDL